MPRYVLDVSERLIITTVWIWGGMCGFPKLKEFNGIIFEDLFWPQVLVFKLVFIFKTDLKSST